MSFFFAKAATAPSKATHAPKSGGLNPPTASMRRNAGTLNRLNCAVCPLNNAPVNSPKLPPTLAGDTQIYFLGTAPGKHEDGSGKPFTGRVAKILRDCLPEGARCSFDYVIRDRPPKDRPPAFAEIECCRNHVIKSIEQARPKLIVGLGPVPLHWVLGSNDLVGMRGRMFAVKIGQHSCYFMATYAPAHVLEKAYDKAKPLRGKFGNCLAMDISRAFKFADSSLRPHIASFGNLVAGIRCFSGSHEDHFSQLMGLLQQAKQAPIKAIDLETKGLRPFAADGGIMTAAISFDDTHFSFAIGHPKAKWADPQLMAILEEFRVLLMDGTMKVAHNAPFELEWLIWLFGKSVVNHAVWHDSMVQAHLLDERRGKAHGNDHGATYQSLDFLAKQHFGLAYKASFKVNKKDMSKSDLGETLIYNAVDTKVTLRLFHHQERLLKKHNSYEAYLDAVPRQCSVALMQTLGIGVDQVEVKRLQKKLNRQVTVLDQQIAELDVVKQYNTDHKEKFNPASDRECLIIFRDYLKAPEVELKLKPWEVFNFNVPSEAKRKFATGEVPEYSTSKATLSKINHPLAALVPTRRTSAKNLSTYCDQLEIGVGNLVYPDGKIHCNFNTTFTETGRLSCVAWWTPVTTLRGILPICDVRVGDFVWTHAKRWQPVLALWRKGWHQMIALYLTNGQVLTCTKDHRLLLSSGEWSSVGEICGIFKEVGGKPGKCGSSTTGISKQRTKDGRTNCERIEDTGQQCLVDNQELFEQRRASGAEVIAVFRLKNGQQKSYERKSSGEASKLEGRVQRLQGVPYYQDAAWENFCPPPQYNESTKSTTDPDWLGSSSHRWQPHQQRTRQFGTGYEEGACCNSLQAATGQQVIEIEKAEACGSYEVFDITVKGDSSYETCDIFSHNSDKPNMQNIPHRENDWLRRQIIPPKGYVLLAFDYGQLEACVAAMCSKDRVLVKALWEDYDIHMDFAKRVHAVFPSALIDGDMKELRSRTKNKLVFPAFFGAADESIAGYMNMPLEPITQLMQEFWGTYTGLKRWQDELMRGYYKNGYVATYNGRRRYYPLKRNQAINHPVQGTACEIVCEAMNRLSYLAATERMWHLHPLLNIHDDLTLAVPDNDAVIEEAIKVVYGIMLTPSYECVNVPLSVTASMGRNWYDMAEYKKYWSHRDLKAADGTT